MKQNRTIRFFILCRKIAVRWVGWEVARVCMRKRVRARARNSKYKDGEKMATLCNTAGFYPKVKGKKRKMAEMLASPEFDGNISKLCDEIGVARSTFYRWYEDADFVRYVEWLIERYSDSELANAWRALIKKANSGNVEALKLYFELKGKYKKEIAIDGGVVFISGEDEIPD